MLKMAETMATVLTEYGEQKSLCVIHMKTHPYTVKMLNNTQAQFTVLARSDPIEF